MNRSLRMVGWKIGWKLGWVGGIVALLLAISVTVGAAQTPGVTDTEILLGGMGAMTGAASPWGLAGDLAFKLAIKEVNEAGGIHGRKLRIIMEDEACKPSKGVAAVKKLIDRDNVFGILGPTCSTVAMAIKPIVSERMVPMVVPTATTPGLVNPIAPSVFQLFLPNDKQADILVDVAYAEFKPKRPGVFYQLEEFGKTLYDGTVAALARHGAKPVEVAAHNIGDTDLSSHVLKLKNANVDVVFAYSFPREMGTFLRQAHELGLKARFMTQFVGELPIMTKLVPKEALAGYIGLTSLVDIISGPLVKPFIEKYKREYPEYSARPTNPSGADGQTYGAALVFMEGLRRAGRELTREKFVKALETLKDFETGVIPPVTFGPDKHDGRRLAKFFIYNANGEVQLYKEKYYHWQPAAK